MLETDRGLPRRPAVRAAIWRLSAKSGSACADPETWATWKFRALGIPTVKDRVVQAALKNILEPVFEADFYPSSYGVRPGRSAHGELEQLRLYLRPCKAGPDDQRRLTYQWAIQGDIKARFRPDRSSRPDAAGAPTGWCPEGEPLGSVVLEGRHPVRTAVRSERRRNSSRWNLVAAARQHRTGGPG